MRPDRPLAVEQFSSSVDTCRSPHEAWRQRDWPALSPMFRTTPSEPFAMSSVAVVLDDVRLGFATFTAMRWERDAALIKAHSPDLFLSTITLDGRAWGSMAARPFESGPGCLQFTDPAQRSDHISSASRSIMVIIPKAVMRARGIDVPGLHGLVVQSAAVEMLTNYLLPLKDAAASFSEAHAPALARIIVDLVCLAITTAPNVPPSTKAPTAVIAARTFIEQRLDDPTLTTEAICAAVGISRMGLHRIFAAEGGITAYIRGRRLEAVQRALANPENKAPIYTLAEQYCFSDGAHLGRLFRNRYGTTPAAFRRDVSGFTI